MGGVQTFCLPYLEFSYCPSFSWLPPLIRFSISKYYDSIVEQFPLFFPIPVPIELPPPASLPPPILLESHCAGFAYYDVKVSNTKRAGDSHMKEAGILV